MTDRGEISLEEQESKSITVYAEMPLNEPEEKGSNRTGAAKCRLARRGAFAAVLG